MYAQWRFDRKLHILHHAAVNIKLPGEVKYVIILSVAVVNAMKTVGTLWILFSYFVLQLSYFLAFENSTQKIASAVSEICI